MILRKYTFVFFFSFLGIATAPGQSLSAQSDPSAVALATKSYLALTAGRPVQDVTLTGSATWIAGSDEMRGQAVLKVKGSGESRIDLSLGGMTRSEIRSDASGAPDGSWVDAKGRHPSAIHNSWRESAWFFPASFSAYSVNDPTRIFSLIGTETRDGISVVHIRTALRKKMHSANASKLTEQLSGFCPDSCRKV